MEYAIAIFVGVWIAAAGVLSYLRIRKDYKEIEIKKDKESDNV